MLQQERQRAEGLARELTSAREAAKQQQLALEQERSKREGLARELASARAQAERVSAVEFNAHAANKMLQQERQKSEGLTRELATAREQQNSTSRRVLSGTISHVSSHQHVKSRMTNRRHSRRRVHSMTRCPETSPQRAAGGTACGCRGEVDAVRNYNRAAEGSRAGAAEG